MRRVITKSQRKAARIRHKEWSDKNRHKINKGMRERRRKAAAINGRWLQEGPKAVALDNWYKKEKSKPCTDCGQAFAACCMDFDHRDGTKKKYCIGAMVAHHYSMKVILKEFSKCDLVCANCHRIRTRDRLLGRRIKLREAA